MPRSLLSLAPLLLATITASASTPADHAPTHEQLNATLWVQTAAEHHILARTAFARAADHVESRLADPTPLPPAVVLDIDETVLDNSPYQAELIHDDDAFDPDTWAEWVSLGTARPIPGAADFIRGMRARGVAVIYITNRREPGKQATLDNLREALDPAADPDTLLMRDARPEWTGDKQTRRDYARERYTVLATLGDDLNDFVTVYGLSVRERNFVALLNQHRFTHDWFLLPNPMYGSWERAVLNDAPDRTRETAIKHKTNALERP